MNFTLNSSTSLLTTLLPNINARLENGVLFGSLPIAGSNESSKALIAFKKPDSPFENPENIGVPTGEFNFSTRTSTIAGAAATTAFTGEFSSDSKTLKTCSVYALSINFCPADSINVYQRDFTSDTLWRAGTNPQATIRFYFIRSGQSFFAIRTGEGRFEIGLPADTNFVPKTILLSAAGDTSLRQATLTENSMRSTISGTNIFSYEGALAPLAPTASPSIRALSLTDVSARPFNGGKMLTARSSPLVVSIGVPNGTLDGHMEIGLTD